MKKIVMIAALAVSVSACSSPAEEVSAETGVTLQEAQKAIDAAEARRARIEEVRSQDTALDWARFSISTSKYNEWTSSGVYKTRAECVAAFDKDSNECIPIPALPQSYWDAEATQ